MIQRGCQNHLPMLGAFAVAGAAPWCQARYWLHHPHGIGSSGAVPGDLFSPLPQIFSQVQNYASCGKNPSEGHHSVQPLFPIKYRMKSCPVLLAVWHRAVTAVPRLLRELGILVPPDEPAPKLQQVEHLLPQPKYSNGGKTFTNLILLQTNIY